jgi:acetyl-CoA acyltransferase 1
MGITSENVATRCEVSRRDQDEFALLSHTRALEAQQSGKFSSEIIPVEWTRTDDVTGAQTTLKVERDDTIRPGVTLEKLAKLKPAFSDDGRSTAGNS